MGNEEDEMISLINGQLILRRESCWVVFRERMKQGLRFIKIHFDEEYKGKIVKKINF